MRRVLAQGCEIERLGRDVVVPASLRTDRQRSQECAVRFRLFSDLISRSEGVERIYPCASSTKI